MNKSNVIFVVSLLTTFVANAAKPSGQSEVVAGGPNQSLLSCFKEIDSSLTSPSEYLGVEKTIDELLSDVKKIQGDLRLDQLKSQFEIFLTDLGFSDSKKAEILSDVAALFAYSEKKSGKAPELKSLRAFIRSQGGKSENVIALPGGSTNHNLDELTLYLPNGNAYETGKLFESISSDENNPSTVNFLVREPGMSSAEYLNYSAFAAADISQAEIDFTHMPDVEYSKQNLTLANGEASKNKLIQELSNILEYHQDRYEEPLNPQALKKAINVCLIVVKEDSLRKVLNEKLKTLPVDSSADVGSGSDSVITEPKNPMHI